MNGDFLYGQRLIEVLIRMEQLCLCKSLNKTLRSHIQKLSQRLKEIYQQGQSTTKVYRFQLIKTDEIERISNNKHQFLSIHSFLYTLVNEDYSKFLLSSVLSNPDTMGDDVLAVYRPFANITRESSFPNEEEILFTIGCIFSSHGNIL